MRVSAGVAAAGADFVRVAVDSSAEADAIAEIRSQTRANLVVDLQENYRLAERIAPHVDKLRYNPGHLYHHEKHKPWREKVQYLVEVARDHDCAIRVGVNCGSVDPVQQAKYAPQDKLSPMLDSALGGPLGGIAGKIVADVFVMQGEEDYWGNRGKMDIRESVLMDILKRTGFKHTLLGMATEGEGKVQRKLLCLEHGDQSLRDFQGVPERQMLASG